MSQRINTKEFDKSIHVIEERRVLKLIMLTVSLW